MSIFKDQCYSCGKLVSLAKTGRPRLFCSNACRQRHYRASKILLAELADTNPIPVELRNRARWILHRSKRPISLGGWWSSVNDSTTWMSYGEAADAVSRRDVETDGYGFVLNGDGIVCLDLDDCVQGGEPTTVARDFVRALGDTYVEFSPSGRGLHVWGFSDIPKGRVIAAGSLKVEIYPSGRFITMTGKPYREGGLAELHITNALRLVA